MAFGKNGEIILKYGDVTLCFSNILHEVDNNSSFENTSYVLTKLIFRSSNKPIILVIREECKENADISQNFDRFVKNSH